MSRRLNLERLRGVIAVFDTIEPENRLDSLVKLARDNGGAWDWASARLPVATPIYIEVFKIRATAETLDDLPSAWIAEAQRLLEAAA
ncbi:hypothetical protein [uncultured Ruegeria sp.]|uniref:hypothetical protein n=1 Tax=uncultured Ruegeria sp. TaxID=259304 RepID=UPI0026127BE7|nr:hypothetical protein [uncultured Ruegeria sp.]